MTCPKCGSPSFKEGAPCPACEVPGSTSAGPGSHAATALDADEPTRARSGGLPPAGTHVAPLAPGQQFGPRYRLLKTLGQGGMGAVYQAWDEDLGVAVALKVIRPDALADEAAAYEVERRFKRELLLARQVTHRNVVRIHDMGEVDGVRYFTMPHIDGEDLAAVLRREGRLPIGRVLAIAKELAAGMAAAHEAGVVHRDLKPANVMIDAVGTAIIMDFGVSRSVETTATATRAGAVMGTLEYMAPEQAQGKPVDQRADIYALGLILYDMVNGSRRVSQFDSAMAELMARMTKPLPPIRTVAPETPAAVDAIITKCLQTDPSARHQTAAELLKDLESLDGDGHPLRSTAPAAVGASRWLYAAIALGVVACGALGGVWWLWSRATPAATLPHDPVTVLVASFENRAGEAVFDGLIEQALSVGIEGASFVTTYPRRDALRTAAQLPGGVLDVKTAKLISIREGIGVVLGGSIAAEGKLYRLRVEAVAPAQDRTLFDWSTTAGGKDEVLAAVGRMAAKVRRQLGDTTASEDRVRTEETFTARSLDAAKAYVRGQELQWAGKQDQAITAYKLAIELDPDFGRAFAGLGANTAGLGRRQEAEQYYQEAFKRLDRMTDREKYRTRGSYYLLTQNAGRAIEEFQALVTEFPADSSGLANLAVAHFLRRDFKQAMELGRRASAIFPKNVLRKNNLALYAMYAGDFARAEKEAGEVLALSPQYLKAFIATALSQLAQGRTEEAAATYRRLDAMSAAGRSNATTGLADLAMYEGRLGDAEKLLEPLVASAASGASKDDRARWLVSLGCVYARRGDARRAVDASDRAAALSSYHGILFLAARNYIEGGQEAKARAVAATLGARLDDEPQIHAKLIEGEIDFKKGRAREAVEHYRAAQAIGDSWLGHYDLGLAYLEAGQFTEAYGEFEKCLARRGEATAVFLDDIPTYRFFAPVHYYLGRAQEGLNSPAAAESYRTFLAIKAKGDERSIVDEAKRRVAPR